MTTGSPGNPMAKGTRSTDTAGGRDAGHNGGASESAAGNAGADHRDNADQAGVGGIGTQPTGGVNITGGHGGTGATGASGTRTAGSNPGGEETGAGIGDTEGNAADRRGDAGGSSSKGNA